MEQRKILIVNNEMMQAPASRHSSPEISILALVDLSSTINLDDLVRLTPQFTWNQVFHTVDLLSRQGKISLRRRNHSYDVMRISGLAQHQ